MFSADAEAVVEGGVASARVDSHLFEDGLGEREALIRRYGPVRGACQQVHMRGEGSDS